jgi:hypothetical protein
MGRIKRYIWLAVSAFLLILALVVVNQLLGLYANLYTIDPLLAQGVTGFLSVLFLMILISPMIILMRLPKTLTLPENESDLPAYREKVIQRMSSNKRIRQANLNVYDPEELTKARILLDGEARKIIENTAGSVFLTTAVSQNGKLDAMTVLVTQTRMVWRIAHIYWQRPSIKDMITLYGNVGATALLASEIEDMDITRQVEPIINSLLNSPGRSLPVVGHAAHIITDSILEGSTNAYLTLRVGVVAQRYCGLSEMPDRKSIRANSYVVAASMLRSIVMRSSGQVISSIMKAMTNAGKRSVLSGLGEIKKAGGKVKEGVSGAVRKMTGSAKEKPASD